MKNQRQSSDSMVVKGTAPLLCLPRMKKLRKKHVEKMTAGYNMAVWPCASNAK